MKKNRVLTRMGEAIKVVDPNQTGTAFDCTATVYATPVMDSKSRYTINTFSKEEATNLANSILENSTGYSVELAESIYGLPKIILRPKSNSSYLVIKCSNTKAMAIVFSLNKQIRNINEKLKSRNRHSLITRMTDYGVDYNRESFYDTIEECLDANEEVFVKGEKVTDVKKVMLDDIAEDSAKINERLSDVINRFN